MNHSDTTLIKDCTGYDGLQADKDLKVCMECRTIWESYYVSGSDYPTVNHYDWFNLKRGKEKKTCPNCEKRNEKRAN